MKIAVATNNGVSVTGHLGSCRSFIVYEVENNNVKNRTIRENVFTHHQTHGHNHGEGHQHGEGNHGHNELIEGLRDCQAVIFNSGGWRVVDDLRSNNIQPFLTDETDADTAIRKYLNGELEERPENRCTHHE
ncbi:MAG: hypothetical protein K8H86_12960 [Ignavibacteriaceae bacterium]|nr:hypothetical protein [Ignavibacteriaceae bacterium]